jgi:hypothetical protein
MRNLHQSLLLLALLACAGCTKASDSLSSARRDHILAGPHGWIDVTLHAPPAAALAPAKGGASTPAQVPDCVMAFTVNGEPQFDEVGDLIQADAANNALGYRFVAPAGALRSQLTISACVQAPIAVALPVTLEKDHLALLEFDGQRLALKSTQPYAPTSLDGLHGETATLQQRADAADATLSRLTKLAIASVLLNVVVLVVALTRRRR